MSKQRLGVTIGSLRDLKVSLLSSIDGLAIQNPFYTSKTKNNIKQVFHSKTVETRNSVMIAKIPYERTKTDLKRLVSSGVKYYALYIRWYQIGSRHFYESMGNRTYYVVLPVRGKVLYDESTQKDIVVSTSGVWITNMPCKSRNGTIVYKINGSK